MDERTTSLQPATDQSAPHVSQLHELVLGQLTAVQFIARRVHERLPLFVPFEDLVSAGVLGLLEATDKYDLTKNVQFKTYAQFRIQGAIIDSLRDLDPASRRLRVKSRKLDRAAATLSVRFGRQPTEDELAAEAGLSIADLRELSKFLAGIGAVGQQIASQADDMHDLIESAPADPDRSPFVLCQRAEMIQFLTDAIFDLSEKEQQVISLYYVEQLTMHEIATVVGVSRPRISQIHTEAIAKMRAHFAARDIISSSDPIAQPV